MSVKKQIPSLCELYSIYKEKPDEFLDETDVDWYFYHNVFDISQSQHRIVRVSRGSNEKSVAIKLFQFFDLKTQQRYILQEEVNIFEGELTSLVDILRNFLETFDHAVKMYTDTPTEAQNWDWIYKVKRQSLYSLLQRYHWTSEKTNSFIVLIWKQQFLRIFHQIVWTTRPSIYSYKNCQP